MSARPPLRKYHMYLTDQIFEELGGGLVKVTAKDGRFGIFRFDGPWIEGELREANLNMLLFTGGPDLPPEFSYRWTQMPADLESASGWPDAQERTLKAIGVL